jgi:hypothetical protein
VRHYAIGVHVVLAIALALERGVGAAKVKLSLSLCRRALGGRRGLRLAKASVEVWEANITHRRRSRGLPRSLVTERQQWGGGGAPR